MKKSFTKKSGGFSLVELLVVLTVVGMLLALTAPSLFSMFESTTLSGEGSLLRNELTKAQQDAVSKSADVEVRFFTLDSESTDDEKEYVAFQFFQFNNEGEMEPTTSLFQIKEPTVFSERFSTLLAPESGATTEQDRKYGVIAPHQGTAEIPSGFAGRSESAEYVSFRFLPDGSTDLPNKTSTGDTWYLTLIQSKSADDDGLPRNFYCLQINPFNGVVSEFRP